MHEERIFQLAISGSANYLGLRLYINLVIIGTIVHSYVPQSAKLI